MPYASASDGMPRFAPTSAEGEFSGHAFLLLSLGLEIIPTLIWVSLEHALATNLKFGCMQVI
jgi:hypothetical protein